jgi:hypothetical protein
MFKMLPARSAKATGLQKSTPVAVRWGEPRSIASRPVTLQRSPAPRTRWRASIPAKDQMKVGAPADAYEREADTAARQVLQAGGHWRPGASVGGSGALDSATRSFYETRFGHDFGAVRVHADRQAAESAGRLGARAYTVGRDIWFGEGQYQPSSTEGRRLLAHELAHVVQQTRSPQNARRRSVAASLSKTHGHVVQRELVATGDAAGFAELTNAVLAVQVEVVVGSGGVISLRDTNIQGPPTPEAQVLRRVLRKVINDSDTTSIEFVHGDTTARASDRRVLGGSFPQSKVDLDDQSILGTQESLGLGQGATAGSLLAHEIEEQWRKQTRSEDFSTAHAAALAVEAEAVGARRVSSRSGNHRTYTYTYPDGHVTIIEFDVENGQRRNVRRTVRPAP